MSIRTSRGDRPGQNPIDTAMQLALLQLVYRGDELPFSNPADFRNALLVAYDGDVYGRMVADRYEYRSSAFSNGITTLIVYDTWTQRYKVVADGTELGGVSLSTIVQDLFAGGQIAFSGSGFGPYEPQLTQLRNAFNEAAAIRLPF
ncbi:MAG: hypothetical protein ACXIVO_01630 [Glycocaulis sp.]